MLKFFGRFIIGGRSGKREQAWAVFLLWCFAFAWMAAKEAAGVAVDGTQSILSLAFPMVIANLALAHGMEWVSTQTGWGDGQ
ncbi:hypothetical protein ETW23_06060 [Leisingera sp. NJS201]|uniref:hypothetical protein n=1 Tax=Leisingera sp. NJS201 TaxID=2508306 RepID=UPI001070A70D|nr:hypothetical protein [Leisingera sp. NJS201]QBR35773.1 hypothetical protein ETW23_06060 [Leisingera sp. NJS201]